MAGEENKEADMLSRLPMEVNVIDPNQELYHVDCCENLSVTAAEVAQETKADPILRRAYQVYIVWMELEKSHGSKVTTLLTTVR